MSTTYNFLKESVVYFYTRKDSVLMKPTIGIIVNYKNIYHACTVYHTTIERDSTEIWNGVHPDVAKQFEIGTKAQKILDINLTNDQNMITQKPEFDIMSIKLTNYSGPAIDIDGEQREETLLLKKALITFPKFDPDASGILSMELDGIAGLVSYENKTKFIISAFGSEGLSGAPVLLETNEGKLDLAGFYTGTPITNVMTPEAVKEFASVVKLSNLFKDFENAFLQKQNELRFL